VYPPAIPSPTPEPRWSRLTLIAANLVPLVGVLFLDWDLLSILLLYWLETLLICALNLLRALNHPAGTTLGSALVFLLVFVVLNAAHLAVLISLAGALGVADEAIPNLSALADAPLFSALEGLYSGALGWIIRDRPELLIYGLPALALGQLLALRERSVLSADRHLDSADTVLRQALGRIIALHLALLLGSVAIAMLQADTLLPVLALLILLKLMFDLQSHR
jgi:hypothetical protein